jgi:DNA-binding NtrC family response regulator
MANVLIVEDDQNSAEMLAELCQADGHVCSIATDLSDARQQALIHRPDIVLLDLHLPDGSGLELFEDATLRGDAEIILITGNASVETSVQALRLGASDYLIKPINAALLSRAIRRARSHPRLGEDAAPDDGGTAAQTADEVPDAQGLVGMRGQSAVMREIYRQIRKVAPTSVSVLVVGESGTGKELVAEAVHRLSRRRGEPFKAINCGAISEQLIESELFGHEKGSFTGAVKQHRGIFEQADGGTLFLDEITEMPAELQVRLLRVLETGSFSRVGSDAALSTDVRIVAATNRDPVQAVEEGLLREDLYYRLNVFQIDLPPLRERAEDVRAIAEHFLADVNRREGRDLRFSEEALAALQAYSWPGNVRELRNVVNRIAILADDESIGAESIPESDDDAPAPGSDAKHGIGAAPTGRSGTLDIRVGMTLEEAEKALILATLSHNDGSREKSAEMLGINSKTLYNRLKRYQS